MLKKVTHLTKDGLLSKELPVPNCTKYCGRNQVLSSGAAGHLHQLPCRGYQPQCWGPGYCKRRRPDCLFQLHVKMLNIWRASMAKIEAPWHFQALGWDFEQRCLKLAEGSARCTPFSPTTHPLIAHSFLARSYQMHINAAQCGHQMMFCYIQGGGD